MKNKKHPLYGRWGLMKQRCNDKNRRDYKYYGGKGIKVCDEWSKSFRNYLSYVLTLDHAMEPGYSLDRIEGDDNYKPGNIRWATKSEQMSNRAKFRNNTSGYVGVSFFIRNKKWHARVNSIHLGYFESKREAVEARNRYIIENNLTDHKIQSCQKIA